jgi:hypothetical protein
MRELDLNVDGKISLEEYITYYLKNCNAAQIPFEKNTGWLWLTEVLQRSPRR